jgi:hypothetical protein
MNTGNLVKTKHTVPFQVTIHFSLYDAQHSLFRLLLLVESLSDLAIIMETFWV